MLWILAIAALGLVVCCGAVGVLTWRFGAAARNIVANMATSDPDEIRKQTAEMVDISIPDTYRPMQGMNMVVVRMVMYQTDASPDGSLMLMEMAMQQMGVDVPQQQQELRKSIEQQPANQNFQSSKSETREIEIRGEPIPFEFNEGTNAGQDQKIHMIRGVFRGKRGAVLLQLMIPDDDYDEDAVLEMLQSIK